MRKVATIIDFNNIAIRAMFTCLYMGNSGVQNFDTDEECDILVRKIATDLSLVLRTFSPDRVIVACDSKDPWRNSVYGEIEGEEYKGTREKDETKNWEKIYEAFNDFKEVMRNKGFVITEIENAEADDLARMWRDSLFRDGYDVIMVSSDKDWSQLITYRPKSSTEDYQFCISYNPIAVKQMRKLYVSQEFMDWYNTEDVADIFFSNYDEMKNKFRDIMRCNPKLQFEVVNPDMILLEKIMCGDDGDNIPTFFEYYKNGKKTRVTPLKCSHVLTALDVKNVNDLYRCADDGSMKDALEKEMKKEIDLDFCKRLKRQRTLVELNESFFPDTIVREFHVIEEENRNKGCIQTNNIKMEDILEGTRYLKAGYNEPRENSIFDDINALTKFSKAPSLF